MPDLMQSSSNAALRAGEQVDLTQPAGAALAWGRASLSLRGTTFRPALFCAPMAGLTHSAFRRLVSDFGGYGALFTEMLSGKWLLHENLQTSASVRRRACEGQVIYQVMISDPADVTGILLQLARLHVSGIDLNCACPAPKIRCTGAGSELFEDRERLAAILDGLRRGYAGLLTAKIRLGSPRDGWRDRLADRLRLFEECGVDAVILHPRFSDEKLKRRARHELLPELAASTRLPLIASGDLTGPQTVAAHPECYAGVAGLMVGRMAVVQPWIFAHWSNPGVPDYLDTWTRFFEYAGEDYPPEQALRRIKAFTMYFARNFVFGHSLFAATQSAPDLETVRERAARFLSSAPQVSASPSIQSLA